MSSDSPVSKPGSSGNDGLILGALAGVIGLAAVVWAGAALAAFVSGGGSFRAGLPEAIQALLHLPAERSDPRRAWPEPIQGALPGPLLYWACTVTVLVVVATIARFGWGWWRRSTDRGRVRLGVDVRARFASLRDLAPLVVDAPPPAGRFVLGRVSGRLVATEDARGAPMAPGRWGRRVRQGDRGSVAVIGPSRSGKTVNVISGLLDWTGPAVVVSVKRDLLDATLEQRSSVGAVAVFDPAGITGLKPAQLTRWSPLRAADSSSGAQKAAAALAASIPRSGVDGGADYWVSQAEILLTGLLATASLNPARTMEDVASWVFAKDMPVEGGRASQVMNEIKAASANGSDKHGRARWAIKQLDAVWRLDERVRSSVYATLQTVVKPWLDPSVAASAKVTDEKGNTVAKFIDLEWLNAGPNTLYLVAPLADQVRFSPVLGGLIGDLKDQAYQLDVSGKQLARPLLMVIDEAGNMPLSWLPEVASTCAGIGILLVTIWQSKAQLDAAYGKLADSVLTNHLTKIVFAGCSDASTLDYVSRLLGEEEVQRRSVTFDTSGGGGRRSVSEGPQREALAPFHLLRQAEPGHAILIHGTLPPAHLQGRRYWEERPKASKRGSEPVESCPAGQPPEAAGLAPDGARQSDLTSSPALFAPRDTPRDTARDSRWSRWLRRTTGLGATR